MNNKHLGGDVLAYLATIIPDTPEMRRIGKQEWLRLSLTDVMRTARKRAGLSQKELAAELGVGQSWVSKLESANYDHQVESVLAHLDAIGADLLLAVKLGDELLQVKAEGADTVLVDLPAFYEDDAKAAGMSLKEYVLTSMASYSMEKAKKEREQTPSETLAGTVEKIGG